MEQEDTKESTKLLVNEDFKEKDKKTWLPHLIGAVLSFTSAASLTAALAFVQVSMSIFYMSTQWAQVLYKYISMFLLYLWTLFYII